MPQEAILVLGQEFKGKWRGRLKDSIYSRFMRKKQEICLKR